MKTLETTPVRVLHYTYGGKYFGGIENYLLQRYKCIDKDKVEFSFLFRDVNSLILFADEMKCCEVYEMNIFQHAHNKIDEYIYATKYIYKLLSSNRYDVVHIHMENSIVITHMLVIAHLCGVKACITHSHSTENYGAMDGTVVKKILQPVCRKIICRLSKFQLACSLNAGAFLFGRKGTQTTKFSVANNAIDSIQYRYSSSIRLEIRKRFNTPDSRLIVGHIGRFAKEKNHEFIIEIVKCMVEQHPNTECWLIGSGELEDQIRALVIKYKLGKNVKMIGQSNNVAELLQAMDVFVLPSRYEGLGIVAIEAQAAGLRTIVSTGVPTEVNITDLIERIPLSYGAEIWAQHTLSAAQDKVRRDTYSEIVAHGYDTRSETKRLQDLYLSCI